MLDYNKLDSGIKDLTKLLNDNDFPTQTLYEDKDSHPSKMKTIIFDMADITLELFPVYRTLIVNFLLRNNITRFYLSERYAYQSDITEWKMGCNLVLEIWE